MTSVWYDEPGCIFYEYDRGSWDSPPCENCAMGMDISEECGPNCEGYSPVLDEATARNI